MNISLLRIQSVQRWHSTVMFDHLILGIILVITLYSRRVVFLIFFMFYFLLCVMLVFVIQINRKYKNRKCDCEVLDF